MASIKNNVLIKYLRESKEEMEKVTWPSKKDTIRYSIIVIVASLAVGIYFGLLDWVLTQGLEALIAFTK